MDFIRQLISRDNWTGGDHAAFWRQVNFLDIQPRGDSQKELLAIFRRKLEKECGISIAECGQGNKFLYLDDGLFSGGRLGADLEGWIKGPAPQSAELFIAVIAIHKQGLFFKRKSISDAVAQSGKKISINWEFGLEIEDGIFNVNTSDVLRPTGPETIPP